MAAQSRRTSPAVSALLQSDAQRFEFFQAVRLLEHMARERMRADRSCLFFPVGDDSPPNQETVRFRVLSSLVFPPSEVVSLKLQASDAATGRSWAEMLVSFLGLTGAGGVLPRHYTQLVIDRIRQHKDFSLRDFLDLFHHRTLSLFYRAWQKHRLPATVERAAFRHEAATRKRELVEQDGGRLGAAVSRPTDAEDLFTSCLYCLVGLGTGKLRGRLEISDAAFLYYGGHFAHYPRTATALEAMLRDYFALPAKVLQFQGRWLQLSAADRSRMPWATAPQGQNCSLGRSVVIGRRVWSVENKFRIQLGPLTYDQFRRFMPQGDGLTALCQLVRAYAGPEFDFDVQPVLKAAEVPACRAETVGPARSQLGWNTWLRSRPLQRDAADGVFEDDGYPVRPAL